MRMALSLGPMIKERKKNTDKDIIILILSYWVTLIIKIIIKKNNTKRLRNLINLN